MVQMLACWTCALMVPITSLGLCGKWHSVEFAYFPQLAAWLDMTYDTERLVKPKSFIDLFNDMEFHNLKMYVALHVLKQVAEY